MWAIPYQGLRPWLTESALTGLRQQCEGAIPDFVIACHSVLQPIAGTGMIPDIGMEKLLEGARGEVVKQCYRFDALALQIAELPAHVMVEMFARLRSPEAVGALSRNTTKMKQLDNLVMTALQGPSKGRRPGIGVGLLRVRASGQKEFN